MRDIVPKVSANRPQEQRHALGKDVLQETCCAARRTLPHAGELFADLPPCRRPVRDADEESVGSQDSGASVSSLRPDVPSYQSFRQYLDGYSTLRFRPVKLPKTDVDATHVDGGGVIAKLHANNDDARLHKAEITIQVRPRQAITMCSPAQACEPASEAPAQTADTPPPPPPPCAAYSPADAGSATLPPPPPAMPTMLPSKIIMHAMAERGPVRAINKPVERDLKTCLMDELKAKHVPREYPFQQEVDHGACVRRTSEPLNAPNAGRVQVPPPTCDSPAAPEERKLVKPPLPAYPAHSVQARTMQNTPHQPAKTPMTPMKNGSNSLPRRWSDQHHQNATKLANPDAHTVTKVPSARGEGPIDRDDPNVKKLVYATLRNYVGAYNNHANRIVAQKDHVVQDKGVTEQINSILASGNLAHLNGRINPKASE